MQAQADAASGACAGAVTLEETLEYPVADAIRHSYPFVSDFQHRVIAFSGDSDGDPAAIVGKFHRI